MEGVRSLKSLAFPLTLNATRAHFSLAILYLFLIFILPADKLAFSQYHLGGFEYHVLLFMISLPLYAVWFAAYYGYIMLRAYTNSIEGGPENGDFKTLTKGCGWLAWSLPIPAIVGLTLNAIANSHASFHSAAVIIVNYLNLAMLLTAFSLIGVAAHSLISRSKTQFALSGNRALILLLAFGSVLYCYLSFRHLGSASLGASDNPFFLPVWLWLLTILVPYLYAGYLGAQAAYEINIFSVYVRGVVYRQPLRLLAAGLIVDIVCFIALEYLNSIAPRNGHLVLNYKLLLVSCFRIMAAIGFALIAQGAIRLKKIEEV